MNQEQIREVLNNFANIKWDSENYNNFVAHVKALNIDTLDPDLKQKVTSFLNNVDNSQQTVTPESQVNNAINNIERQALEPSQPNVSNQAPVFDNQPTENIQPKPVEPVNDGLNPVVNEPTSPNINVVDGLNLDNQPDNNQESLNNLNTVDGLNPINQENLMPSEPEAPNINVADNLGTTPPMDQPEPINTQMPTSDSGVIFNQEEPKKKKKTNPIIVIILVILLLVAVVAGLVYADIIELPFDKKPKDKAPIVNDSDDEELPSNLICNLNLGEDESAFELESELNATFDEENKVDTIELVYNYKFDSRDLFESEKIRLQEEDDISIDRLEFDEENMIIKAFLNIGTELGTIEDYSTIRNHFIGLGYNCSGEETTEPLTEPDIDENLFSINDRVNTTNNFFSYQDLYFEETDDTATVLSGWVTTVTNITDEGQLLNISLTLHDENSIEIGSYMLIPEQEVNETSMFYIAANETKNMNFNITAENLNEGKTIQDIKYFTINDL